MTTSFVGAFVAWTTTSMAGNLSLALLAIGIPGFLLTRDGARPHWAFRLLFAVGAVLNLFNAFPMLFVE